MACEGKKTRVFQVVDVNYRPDKSRAKRLRGLRLVAELETDNVDEAFLLTNTRDDGDWWLRREVTARVAPCRSTSVGDVIVLPDGEGYLIDRVGYLKLGKLW